MLTIRTKNIYGVEEVTGGLDSYGQPHWSQDRWEVGEMYGLLSGGGIGSSIVPISETECVEIEQTGEGRAMICGPDGPVERIVFRGPADAGWSGGQWSVCGTTGRLTFVEALRSAPPAARRPLSRFQPVRNSAGCRFAAFPQDIL